MLDPDRLLTWMEPWIDHAFTPPPFDPAAAEATLAAAAWSRPMHEQLLQKWNGFYAFDGLLHVLGACDAPVNHSLAAWNAPDGWRASWGRLTEGLTFFAQDAFGDQFAYRAGKIVRMRATYGGILATSASLAEWVETVFLEPDKALNQRLFRECVRIHGPLPRGGHFVPTGTVVADEPLDPAAMQVVPVRDSMEM